MHEKVRKRQRPYALWFLFAVFAYSFGKDLEMLIRLESVVDYQLFNSIGLSVLFLSLLLLATLVDGAAALAVNRRYRSAVQFGVASLLVGLMISSIGFAVAYRNSDLARRAYIQSRKSRGLRVNEDAMATMFSPSMMMFTFGVSAAFTLATGAVLIWSRKQFAQAVSEE